MVFSLFRKRFDKLAAKGDAQFEAGQLGLARGEYAHALEVFREGDDAAERSRVEKRLAEVHGVLARRQIDEGDRLRRSDEPEEAHRCYISACELAEGVDAKLVKEAEARLESLYAEIDAARDKDPAPEPEEHDEDPDAELDMLIQPFAEERQDAYRALGPDFRDGYLRLNDGDAEGALAAFDAVETHDPWVDYERGRALVLLERQAEATDALRAAADALDGRAALPVLAHLVQAAIAAEEWVVAAQAIDRFEKIDPAGGAADATTMRVMLARAKGDLVLAERLARAYLVKSPSELPMWRTLGTICEQAEKPGAAVEAYEQVMNLKWRFDPDRRVVHLDVYSTSRLARLLTDAGQRLDRALQLVNALQLVAEPDEHWSLALLRSEIFEKQGDAEAAVSALDDALDAMPDDAPAEVREQLEAARGALAAAAE